MKKHLFLLLFSVLASLLTFAQNDSIFISIFISPTADLIIEEQDSLVLLDEALLIDGINQTYNYEFFIGGFDVDSTDVFEVGFVTTDGTEVSNTFTMLQIDSDVNIMRYDDSVTLPLGEYGYMDIYEFSVSLFDSNNNLIISLSDFYADEE